MAEEKTTGKLIENKTKPTGNCKKISFKEILDFFDFTDSQTYTFIGSLFEFSTLLDSYDGTSDIDSLEFDDTKDLWKTLAYVASDMVILNYIETSEIPSYIKNQSHAFIEEHNYFHGTTDNFASTATEIFDIQKTCNKACSEITEVLMKDSKDLANLNKLATDSFLHPTPFQTEQSFEKQGFVYIAKQLNEKNLYKIGTTKNLNQRINTFKTGNCFIEIVASKKCKDKYLTESWFHKHFQAKRVEREWFNLNNDDLAELANSFGFNFQISIQGG